MRIESIDPTPIAEIDSFTAGRGGRYVEHRRLPVLRGTVSGLPDNLAGIVATSDLQGYHSKSLPITDRLLSGFTMVDTLASLASNGDIPALKDMGVFLPGDFYAIPEMNKRGGIGDVELVWEAFAKHFRWAVGIAGNHDSFKGMGTFDDVFTHLDNMHALEVDQATPDGIRVCGLSGIVGNERKFWHYTIADLATRLELLIEAQPDVLVMHDGPAHPDVRKISGCWYTDMMVDFTGLVIRGHRFWQHPVQDIEGFQVLNVDSRAVVLEAV